MSSSFVLDKSLSTVILSRAGSLRVSNKQPPSSSGLQNTNVFLEGDDGTKYLLRIYPLTTINYFYNECSVISYLESVTPVLVSRLLTSGICTVSSDGTIYTASENDKNSRYYTLLQYIDNDGAVMPQELTDDVLVTALRLLSLLHSCVVPNGIVTAPNDTNVVPDALSVGRTFCLSKDLEYSARLSSLWSRVNGVCMKHASAFSSLPRDSLIHGDAHCGNFLKTSSGLSLVDWESCHRGNELEDIACLMCVAAPPIAPEREQLLLRQYMSLRRTWMSNRDDLMTWLSLFKIRKYCRMISTFHASMLELDPSSQGFKMLSGGSLYFVDQLDALVMRM